MPRPSPVPALLAHLESMGGVASHGELVAATSKSAVRCALASGFLTRVGRASYAVAGVAASTAFAPDWAALAEDPTDEEVMELARARAVALARRGVISHRSAAAQHRWPVLERPERVEITVVPGRPSRPDTEAHLRRRLMPEADHEDLVTTPLRTAVDCARDLPWPEALAVADSAIRSKLVGRDGLQNATDLLRGPRSAQARRVAAAADGDSANPFESALRAHALDVPGFAPTTQYEIVDGPFYARVDVADPRLGIVLEAESFTYHGSAERFARDFTRYTGLTERDWLVLRFTLAEVRRGDPVTSALTAAILARSR